MSLVLPQSAARIAAMDTGARGAVAWRTADKIRWRTVKLPDQPRGARWVALRRQLSEMHAEAGALDAFYFEEAWFIGGHGAQVEAARHRFGCYAVLEAWAYANNLELIGVTPAQAKKALTGNGKAEKRDMIARASHLTGEIIADANVADAIGVLVYGLDHYERYRRAA